MDEVALENALSSRTHSVFPFLLPFLPSPSKLFAGDNRSSYLDINSINSFLIASASNLVEPIWNAGFGFLLHLPHRLLLFFLSRGLQSQTQLGLPITKMNLFITFASASPLHQRSILSRRTVSKSIIEKLAKSGSAARSALLHAINWIIHQSSGCKSSTRDLALKCSSTLQLAPIKIL
jgi:hypothetical protein